ncbi:MAG: ABC transporter ATP-binding protein [Thermoprotei archaeon]|nr:MAG: ABC transporter ATP-binding protein [Thermoprotei archaeon]
MTKYSLELIDITKYYKGKKVLDHINIKVKQGEMLTLLGPPGSGKTTLLKIIAGLERQDQGNVMINGEIVDDEPPYKRKVSMVFETLALYPHLTVFENIASPLIAAKKTKSEIRKRVEEVASLLKIRHLLERKADKLSGGERQRVALARALVKEADIYLFDEPFINLDAKIRTTLRTEFKKLKEALKKTMVFSTPDPLEALALSDNIAIIFNGKIVQYGSPLEIYNNPLNIGIARYITGNILNELYAIVEEINGEIVLNVKGFGQSKTLTVKDMVPEYVDLMDNYIGHEIIIANKANYCYLVHGKSCEGLVVEAEILGFENHGSEILLYVKAGNNVLRLFTSKEDIKYGDIGKKVNVCIDIAKSTFFDKSTGLIIR